MYTERKIVTGTGNEVGLNYTRYYLYPNWIFQINKNILLEILNMNYFESYLIKTYKIQVIT